MNANMTNPGMNAGMPPQYSLAELQALSDLYRNVVQECFQNCVINRDDDMKFVRNVDINTPIELTEEQQKCDNACVMKYMRVHKHVGKLFEETNREVQGEKKQ